MAVVSEVADLLKLVAEGIKNIRDILEATRDGYAYLKRYHPEARKDLAELLNELRNLVQLLAEASSIVTHFDFATTGSAVGLELREFNNRYLQHKAVAQKFEDQLDVTRSHCSQIGLHRAGLEMEAGRHGFSDLFGLLGAKSERTRELAELLKNVYGNDDKILNEFERMIEATNKALDDVRTALRGSEEGSSAMQVENVAQAARVLGAHASHFRPIESEAVFAVRELRAMIVDLGDPSANT